MPSRQRLHWPQPAWISTATRWPMLYSSTPGPSATTVPMYSWPGVKFLLNGAPPWIIGRAVIDDLEIGGADGDGVDAHQHFRLLRHRHRLLSDAELARVAEYPGAHHVGDRKFVVVGLHAGRCVHVSLQKQTIAPRARSIGGGLRPLDRGLTVRFAELGGERARRLDDLLAHQRDVVFAGAHGRRRGADRADDGAGLVANGGADADHARQVLLAVDGDAVAANHA